MSEMYWKKLSKPLTDMSPEERRAFAEALALDSLKALSIQKQEIVSGESFQDLAQQDIKTLIVFLDKWYIAYRIHRLNTVEALLREAKDKLNQLQICNKEQVKEFKRVFYFLSWLDQIMYKPIEKVIGELYSKRSVLKLGRKWNRRLERDFNQIINSLRPNFSTELSSFNSIVDSKSPVYDYVLDYDAISAPQAEKEALGLYEQVIRTDRIFVLGNFEAIWERNLI